MFKNYLTYQFVEGFDRDCSGLQGLSPEIKNELLRCSHALVVHFGRAVRTEIATERAKALFTSISYAQDCRGILDSAQVTDHAVLSRLKVVEGRLEQLFLDSAKAEGGQLRMLG